MEWKGIGGVGNACWDCIGWQEVIGSWDNGGVEGLGDMDGEIGARMQGWSWGTVGNGRDLLKFVAWQG